MHRPDQPNDKKNARPEADELAEKERADRETATRELAQLLQKCNALVPPEAMAELLKKYMTPGPAKRDKGTCR